MEKLVGKETAGKCTGIPGAELIAMYGRRRVGKIFSIRSVYEKYLRFEFTGLTKCHDARTIRRFQFCITGSRYSPVNIAISLRWLSR